MIGDDYRNLAVASVLIRCTRPRRLAMLASVAEQRLRGKTSHHNDNARLDQFDLAAQERLAGRHFCRLPDCGYQAAGTSARWRCTPSARLSPWRLKSDTRQHAVEQTSSLTDERFAACILLGAGRFTDEHPIRVAPADSEDNLRASCRPAHTRCNGRAASASSSHPRRVSMPRTPCGCRCLRCKVLRSRHSGPKPSLHQIARRAARRAS
jgi:hypothetical protein